MRAVEVRDEPEPRRPPPDRGRHGTSGAWSWPRAVMKLACSGCARPCPPPRPWAPAPGATFLSGRFDRYQEVSRNLHAIFERYTPLIEPIALDEAFLDVAGAQRLFGPAPALGSRIRAEVRAELGLACWSAWASNKFLAKLASEVASRGAKCTVPVEGEGVVVVDVGHELAFLHPLSIEALWGVGPATAQTPPAGRGSHRRRVVACFQPRPLQAAVGQAAGRHLHRLSMGIDLRPVESGRVPKSVGHEETWNYDRFDSAELRLQILRMADAVSSRCVACWAGWANGHAQSALRRFHHHDPQPYL